MLLSFPWHQTKKRWEKKKKNSKKKKKKKKKKKPRMKPLNCNKGTDLELSVGKLIGGLKPVVFFFLQEGCEKVVDAVKCRPVLHHNLNSSDSPAFINR